MASGLKAVPQVRIVDAAPELLLSVALEKLRKEQEAGGREPIDRHRATAITKLEDVILRLNATGIV